MNYCSRKGIQCKFANENTCCKLSACATEIQWNNEHAPQIIYNLTTEPKRDDGVYAQLFAVKNGARYDMKVISLREISTTLTSSLMDGIEKLCN